MIMETMRKMCCKVFLTAMLLAWNMNIAAQSQATPKYVVLITIDGMRAEMVDDPLMPSPFLKMMSRDGLRIGRVIGVPPAATYPSHTTLVTGEVPARHRIFYNRPYCNNDIFCFRHCNCCTPSWYNHRWFYGSVK